jgi:hypothetical protein
VSLRDLTEDEAIAIHKPWVRELMRRCGIRVEAFSDGTLGLVDVPAKYVAAIDALHRALHHAMIGEDLPEFTREEPQPKRIAARKGRP